MMEYLRKSYQYRQRDTLLSQIANQAIDINALITVLRIGCHAHMAVGSNIKIPARPRLNIVQCTCFID